MARFSGRDRRAIVGSNGMKDETPGQDPEGVEDPRLASLDERLRTVQHAEKVRTQQVPVGVGMSGKGASQGNRVLSVLLGAPLGAALIGWLIDGWLGTSPVALLVMLFLGFGAAVSQVYRISKERVE
jgi:ATP synthase protein I